MTPQETARAILALYDGKPERWTQGVFARTAADRVIGPHEEPAVCWCIVGAAKRVGCDDAEYVDSDFARALARAAGRSAGFWFSPWNDAPERTFADIVALLEKIAAEPTP